MPDDNSAASSTAQSEEAKDESLEASEADPETSEGDESDSKPSKRDARIAQLIAQRKEVESVLNWYRQAYGDPDIENATQFRKFRQEVLKQANQAEQDGDLTPAKLNKIRELMRTADPEYAQFMEQQKIERESRIEAQFDAAEDEIRSLTKDAGISPKDEKTIARLARQVMLEIDSDPKLLKLWQAGNLSCVKKAWTIVNDELIDKVRKASPVLKQAIQDKRNIQRLPTLPSGQGVVSQKGKDPKDKGLTKQANDDAWAVIQATMRD
jgi:hypothetical protein